MKIINKKDRNYSKKQKKSNKKLKEDIMLWIIMKKVKMNMVTGS